MKLFNKQGEHVGDLNDNVFTLVKPKQWEPKEYQGNIFSVDGGGKVFEKANTARWKAAGNEYPTKEAAQESATRRVSLERYNQLAIELNEKYGEPEGVYYYLAPYTKGDWDLFTSSQTTRLPWLVYMSKDAAKEMKRMLNFGEAKLEVE